MAYLIAPWHRVSGERCDLRHSTLTHRSSSLDAKEERPMKVLVAYGSRHGATRGIAERLAARLEGHAVEVAVAPVDQVTDPSAYDAFVIGSAVYLDHWLAEVSGFVRRHREVLASRPTWLFSSGPLGTEQVDKDGRDVRDAAEPKEFAELRDVVGPRGERVFFGAYDPDARPTGSAERLFLPLMPAVRNALPAGDFRDWDEIDAWADAIRRELAMLGGTRVEAQAFQSR
jgi:menaquinone-dependent protoporphyrinogen oxidase